MMNDRLHDEVLHSRSPFSAVILSQTRLVCDTLTGAFAQDARITVRSYCLTLPQALHTVIETRAEVVLFDAGFPGGAPVVTQIRAATPWARVVAVAVHETEDAVLAWVRAGVTGYVADTTPLANVADLVVEILRGKQPCSMDVAGALLRHIAHLGPDASSDGLSQPLTGREWEILRLIGFGMSNKEIARELNISLATTKAHVHNMFGKLKIRRRGEATAWMHSKSIAAKPGAVNNQNPCRSHPGSANISTAQGMPSWR